MSYESCPECGYQKHQLVDCPSCGYYRNKPKRDRAHKRTTQNSGQQERSHVGYGNRSGRQPGKSDTENGKERQVQVKQYKRLRLVSKRGTLIRNGKCAQVVENPRIRYGSMPSHREAGVSMSCMQGGCMVKVIGNAAMDAMDRAVSGHFEGNRRRR